MTPAAAQHDSRSVPAASAPPVHRNPNALNCLHIMQRTTPLLQTRTHLRKTFPAAAADLRIRSLSPIPYPLSPIPYPLSPNPLHVPLETLPMRTNGMNNIAKTTPLKKDAFSAAIRFC